MPRPSRLASVMKTLCSLGPLLLILSLASASQCWTVVGGDGLAPVRRDQLHAAASRLEPSPELCYVEVGAGVGWTVYPPLSRRIDESAWTSQRVSLHLSGLSSLAGSINVLTTILLMLQPLPCPCLCTFTLVTVRVASLSVDEPCSMPV